VAYADVMQGEDGRSKGCGIVEFEEGTHAATAIRTMNDTDLGGRVIFVREDREDYELKALDGRGHGSAAGKRVRHGAQKAAATGSRRVYVNNLSWNTSWQDLKDYFREAGEVVYSKVLEDESTGRSKGCGIVEFSNADEALHAISTLSETDLGGRTIYVREDRDDKEIQ